jgi:hypothetical protein
MTARSWAFIAAKPFLPSADDPLTAGPHASGLGGTEQAILNLTTALAALGDTVTVHGATTTPRTVNAVLWTPTPPGPATTHVAINDARLLPPGASNPTIWFHNEVEFFKELRRRRLPALFRHRPTAIFIGTEQARRASPLLPFRARKIIPYGLSDRILIAPITTTPPPPNALFTSQAYRGLREIIDMWQTHIAPKIPNATLTAHIAEQDIAAYKSLATHPSITIAPRIGNDAILARLLLTRVLLAPGHISETFCLAAAEAIALGVPVATLGIGSLKERVRNNKDGYICRNFTELAARTAEVLTDDTLWSRLHAEAVSTRIGRAWKDVAQQWQAATADGRV